MGIAERLEKYVFSEKFEPAYSRASIQAEFDKYEKTGTCVFRDNFVLGIKESGGGEWNTKNFLKDPNLLFIGGMGSGKSVSNTAICSLYYAFNSDQCVFFMVDPAKGCNDYVAMFPQSPDPAKKYKYENVFPIISEGGIDVPDTISRLIDLLYSEVQARMSLFNSVKANNLESFEAKTGRKMARLITMFEEYHAIVIPMFDFEKKSSESGTTAFKLAYLYKVGRSYGIWFIGASQRATKDQLPPLIVHNSMNKIMFKASSSEGSYLLNYPGVNMISIKGRGRTETGWVQVPYIDMTTQSKIIEAYRKPFNAEFADLSLKTISEYLDGQDPVELYQKKRSSELAEFITSYKAELVIRVILSRIGFDWIDLDSKLDPYGACGVAVDKERKQYLIVWTGSEKISTKQVLSLNAGVREHGCDYGILFSAQKLLSRALYKATEGNPTSLFDLTDLQRFALQVDKKQIDVAIKSLLPKEPVKDDEDEDSGDDSSGERSELASDNVPRKAEAQKVEEPLTQEQIDKKTLSRLLPKRTRYVSYQHIKQNGEISRDEALAIARQQELAGWKTRTSNYETDIFDDYTTGKKEPQAGLVSEFFKYKMTAFLKHLDPDRRRARRQARANGTAHIKLSNEIKKKGLRPMD